MSELKGFAFEKDICLSLPFDFIERCKEYGLNADSILALLRTWKDLEDTEYLELSQLDWLLPETLQDLLKAGFLLQYTSDAPAGILLLPGTPSGRNHLEKLKNKLITQKELKPSSTTTRVRPNLFKLYEDNIGPLTPMVSELLQEDAREFPAEWFEDAIKEALSHNARKWSYVRAILKNWKENGREKMNEKDSHGLEKFKELYRNQQDNTPGGKP
ncbi:MAG TPA: DnaD domain protein [Anaerolineaceae bacterium]|nr:DnaD domain protein [Anaerolineaceae bacterium]